MIPRKNCV